PEVGTNHTFDVLLETGASAFLQTDGLGPLVTGAARVSADVPIGVSAIFSISNDQGEFLTESAVGDSQSLSEFAVPVDTTENFNTGVAFFNSSTQPVTLNMMLLDENGRIVGAAEPLTLNAGNHAASFVTELFPEVESFRGSLFILATDEVEALTLRQNSSPLSFTTLPVVPSSYLAAAGLTDDNGQITLTVAGQELPVEFTDLVTGSPISDVAVGVSVVDEGVGLMLVVDPLNRFPSQIILHELSSSLDSGIQVLIGPAQEGVEEAGLAFKIFNFQASAVPAIFPGLQSPSFTAVGILGSSGALVKVLDKAANDLGFQTIPEITSDWGITRTIDKEVALAEIRANADAGIATSVGLLGFGVTASYFTGGAALPVVQSAAIGALFTEIGRFLDNDTVLNCEEGNLLVTRLGVITLYGCRMPIFPSADQLEMPVNVTASTPDGMPLSDGSVELVRTDSLGEAFVGNLNEEIMVPVGRYSVNVLVPGVPVARKDNVSVTQGGRLIEVSFQPEAEELTFTPPNELPEAMVGFPYSFSFCKPELALSSDLCGGGSEITTNPTGGQPPYHFTLGSGVGFPPFGISLNLNGLLTGTPSAQGTSNFSVCAVDLAGSQVCQLTSLRVIAPLTLSVNLTGDGSGTVTSTPAGINCGSDCTENYEADTVVTLTAVPAAGSTFTGWSGACTGTGSCLVTLDADQAVTAQFDMSASGPQTFLIVTEGQTATLTVDSSGNFTGSGLTGSAPGCSDYPINISNGRMSGTSVTFDISASFCAGQGSIVGTGAGILNAPFPNATAGFGTIFGTISSPLGTFTFNQTWTAARQ
ncbi:MAG: hypothetical protein IIB03_07370, partial [Acidobacteria bacterium]|nr:hypothetical protein [Acidobacteriota bacterium]